MTADQRWLTALWPRIRFHLPPPPATVIEVGCGALGGFVPMLHNSGYVAIGIDPRAPEGTQYRRVQFEESDPPTPVDAVVACTSLHHVADPAEVLDKIATGLASGGVVVAVEWDWKSFDEATARWCFERLGPPEDEGWLHRRRNEWIASTQPWNSYLRTWACQERLHSGQDLLRELDHRFQRRACQRGAYFFPDLAHTTEADELAAIDLGQIRATRIDYAGRLV